MSDFKLEFILKQHTPIIHFQFEQMGATLRATELKPKLDRFLIDIDKTLPYMEHHNDRKSLNYKVKIISKSNKLLEFEKYPPLYFGNQRGSEPKQKIISSEITVEFFSFNAQVLASIKKYFESFLAQTNFGTRQSKGYGNFYIKDKVFNVKLINKEKYTTVYSFESSKSTYEEDIKRFYGLMRSGINQIGRDRKSEFYAKSLLFLYFDEKGMIWDKKSVKMHFVNKNSDTSNQYIIRDLLGLSTFQNWRDQGFNVSKSNRDILRFKSPIIFKPMREKDKVKVYFYAEKFSENHPMLDREFKISGRGSFTISTPSRFDIEDFLKFVQNIKLENFIEKKSQMNHRFYQPLEKVFSSLKVEA